MDKIMADAAKKPWERVASVEPSTKPLCVLNKDILEKNSVRNRQETLKRRLAEARMGGDYSRNGSVAEWLKNNPAIKRCLQLYTQCRFMDHDPKNIKEIDELDEKSFIEFGPDFDARMISDSPKPREYILKDIGRVDESPKRKEVDRGI